LNDKDDQEKFNETREAVNFEDLIMRDFSFPAKDCFLNQPVAGPTRNETVPDLALSVHRA